MKILIVEDERAIADVEKAYMERDGYEADIAGDGAKALELFRRGGYDMVLLDLMLPGMSGVDVCREIRRTSQVPVIMLTALSGEDTWWRDSTPGPTITLSSPSAPAC